MATKKDGIKRKRRVGSVKNELIKKSREAALAAVQLYNNPTITFKSESYVVLMIIAWTYLLHAYYRGHGVEYRYFRMAGRRRGFDKTKHGAFKHWELEQCLNDENSPVDRDTANNLRFLIGLRHEIEHQMTDRIEDALSARFQACGLNYNTYLKKLFGEELGIDSLLSFSLQFSAISKEQKELLEGYPNLPENIESYMTSFDEALSPDEYSNPKFAYRVIFVQKQANHRNQADRVIEFVRSDSPLAKTVNKEYAVIKETEKTKYLPGQIVSYMKSKGFDGFTMHHHTQLWKSLDARNPAKDYGVKVAGKAWHWYERWLDVVREHCEENRDKYL